MPKYIIEVIYERSSGEWIELSNPATLEEAMRQIEILQKGTISQIRLTFNKKGS